MHGLFITGTGTEVGKTYVAALIAKQLVAEGVRVGVYKPVASGCHRREGELVSDDAVALWEAAGRPLTLDAVCPQRFEAPLAPHLAARAEGKRVDGEWLRSGLDIWRDTCDVVLVEGAGGLCSPLADDATEDTDDTLNADLVMEFGFPLVIVAANRLGAINETLLSVMAACRLANINRDQKTAGVVLNDASARGDSSRASNASEISKRMGPPLLGCVGWGGGFDRPIDWRSLAGPAASSP